MTHPLIDGGASLLRVLHVFRYWRERGLRTRRAWQLAWSWL